MSQKLKATMRPSDVDPATYDAILYAGGHGVMWDFPDDAGLIEIGRFIYEENAGVVAAVCHGPAALVNLRLSDGSYLVAGKTVAGFTNDEETKAGLDDIVPFPLETRLVERGATHTKAPPFEPWSVTDGRLVTGQNPASATGVAERILAALGELAAV